MTPQRFLITGPPTAGKTTIAIALARRLCVEPRHIDSLIDGPESWSRCSQVASEWMDEPGPFVIEGVQVPRAMRKWYRRNRTGQPADVLVVLQRPRLKLAKGQIAMAKGVETVLREIAPRARRGIELWTAPRVSAFLRETA